jgi:beta-lactamase regulating signal transducer with metallopeptidase domain
MTAIKDIFEPLIGPVAWALTQFMWQGSLVALGLAALLALQRGRSAVWRYRSACCALLVMVMLPVFAAFTYDGPPLGAGAVAGAVPTAVSAGVQTPAPRPTDSAATSTDASTAPGYRSTLEERFGALLPAYDRLRPWIFAAWLAGVLALSLVHVSGWRRVQRLKRHHVEPAPREWQETTERICRLLGIPRAVRVLKSACVEVPTVIGWLSPVVLVPVSAFTGLTSEQLRDILIHEIAHVKRRDYLVNLLQVVAETLLFFHPAVWWVSRRIRVERENCCDDVAVLMSDDRIGYAKALVRLEEIRLSQPQFAIRADGGSLASRIRRLAGGKNMSIRQNKPWLTGVFLASLLVAGGAALSLAVDRPGTGKDKDTKAVETGVSYAEAEKDFAIEGRWEIDRYGSVTVMEVRVRERHNRMSMSIEFDEDDFTGLDYGDDDEFELRRDAGTLFFVGDFDGSGRSLEGDGRFGFVPNDDFERKVDGRFDDHEMFILAAKDVGFDYIDEMERLGYDDIDGDELVRLAIHGASVEFVKEMRETGYDVPLDQLVKFKIHGVSPEFVQEMADLGYDHISADGLVKWKIHGVSPEFVRVMTKEGVEPLSSDDLVKMKIHGVSPEFVHGMHDAGFGSLDTDELVKWRIHGVSPEFVHGMTEAGVGHMSTDDLTRMRIHGVSPEYVRELKELGYSDVDVDDLVRMRIHGVSPRYIRNVLDKVKEPPSVDDLVKMKIHGIYL